MGRDTLATQWTNGQKVMATAFKQSNLREPSLLEKATILIVDDEENLLLLLERILSKQGYQVETAKNSHDALALLEKRVFELAILDIKMFPIDGVVLLG